MQKNPARGRLRLVVTCASLVAGAAAACGTDQSISTAPHQTAVFDHPDAHTASTGPDAAGGSGGQRDGGSSPIADAGDEAGDDDDGGTTDGPVDVDNGAPSKVYPAPHPPMPQLVNMAGGPILANPKVYLVFYPGYPYASDMQSFITKLTKATYWSTVTSEYGIGALSYGGTITLTGETPPPMITSTTIATWVGDELASGAFGTPDPQGIYTIFYPEATLVTQPNPVLSSLPPIQACVAGGFGGYHNDVEIALTSSGPKQSFAYAVIPTCGTNPNDLTAVLSHEWVEASTDPFLTSGGGTFMLVGGPDSAYFSVDANHAVWAILGGGEAGDLCEPEGSTIYYSPADVGYDVQRIWSNKLARESHDPCAPDLPGPSFNAAPVLTDTVTLNSTLLGGTLVTQGVIIPAATSRTIEVDLYSDSDTGGPITVSADDALSTYYGGDGLEKTLAFKWDRTQGVNGEKLHLTITVTRESILDGVHAFMITSTLGSRQSVWPGLVYE